MGCHVTLYIDQYIDNSDQLLKELQQLLPDCEFSVEKIIFQSLTESPLDDVDFLPVCLVKSESPEIKELLEHSNDFTSVDKGYRLKDRIVRHNAVYHQRQQIPEQLIIFTLRNCPACDKAKELLNQLNIPYQEHNPASRVRRQLRVAAAPSFFYENRYLFSNIESFKHTIWAEIFKK